MTTSEGGTYLRVFRERQRLKQEELGDIIGASRNTVMRMENSTENTRHMTVMQAIETLHASASFYCELVVDSSVTADQVLQRHAVLDGLYAYAHAIARHRGLVGDATSWAGHALSANLYSGPRNLHSQSDRVR
jgi:DNA-binding XRE family transcriptional regulator